MQVEHAHPGQGEQQQAELATSTDQATKKSDHYGEGKLVSQQDKGHFPNWPRQHEINR